MYMNREDLKRNGRSLFKSLFQNVYGDTKFTNVVSRDCL
jgi:hypothetical protein